MVVTVQAASSMTTHPDKWHRHNARLLSWARCPVRLQNTSLSMHKASAILPDKLQLPVTASFPRMSLHPSAIWDRASLYDALQQKTDN